MSPNKNKTKHTKCIVKSTKIPKIYLVKVFLFIYYLNTIFSNKENPFLRKGF